MTSWSEGYVSDITYSIGYYREMAPDHLAFVALATGKSPGLSVNPKRVLELGFGMGLGFVIGAASQPDTFFEGCDFNPEHIAHANRLVNAAGLTNVAIREASFQELATEAKEGQHDLDLIQLHGILTWVSVEAQRAITEIARKRLKPGGLLYVSYNCMPGWAPMLPIQRLMREHAKRSSGNSISKTAGAVQAMKDMALAQGRFFTANPGIAPRLEKLSTLQMSYLAHEYLNENWHIFHFADVAAMMGEAKLSYLASATLAENLDAVAVPAEMQPMVAQVLDPIWKETLRDVASNKQFRRDIYARGITGLNNLEVVTLLNGLKFTLAVPRSAVTLKLPGPLGEMNAKPEIYNPLADLLADRIVPFDEISSSPTFLPVGLAGTLQALTLMVHSGQVMPIVGVPNTEIEPAKRLNKAIVGFAERGRVYNFLAAPVARSGVPATSIDIMNLSAVFAGKEHDAAAMVEHALDMMNRLGSKPMKDGKAVEDPAEMRAVVTQEVEKFLAEKLPLFRRLGCL